MRKKCVILEEKTDSTPLRRNKHPGCSGPHACTATTDALAWRTTLCVRRSDPRSVARWAT